MAPLAKTLALAGALFAAVASTAPVQKREDAVVNTRTTIEWSTVTVTTTITMDQPTPTATQHVASVPAAKPTSSAAADAEPTVQEVQQSSATVQPVWTPAPEPTTSTTSATAAPEPTEQAEPSQSSTTSAVPQPTASSAASSKSSSSSSGSAYTGACSQGSPCTGQVTYYDTATSALSPSSCGDTNDGTTEDVLALPVGLMQASDCGRTVTVVYNGKTVSGKVVDKCMGCDSTSIDLSRHFFNQLASEDEGRLHNVEWYME
ncbi:hypothetical protein BDV26DRAFT_275179 [Aspergillus bertholletiae]|uniref:RlpA-like double-psi beta-barrel-protein domain-containing protein-containing protein n=1 Tax=Aspergillus bertholletiae TaxID=1226010 RepID=A0A5N7APY5_9EURO|nr:hypothetical protein BDV26DRAFT_275179 [Aspergillus bertholletiae]